MFKKDLLLSVILLAVIVPTPAFAQSPVENDAQSLLSAFMSYTDLRIRAVQQSLEILAATAEARSGKWESMRGLLELYQELDGKLAVWYVLPDGTYYTVDKGLMDVTLADRPYFPDLMAGKNVIGSLVVSRSTGQRSAVTAVPIEEGGKVVGGIGASLFLDQVAEEIGLVLRLRSDREYFALASNGQTTLHQKAGRSFLDPREQGSETMTNAVNEILATDAGESTYLFDDLEKKAIYRTSPLTQWKFVITFNAAPPN